ncbi:hypothetical protein AVEN_164094-1 [Araneus ventricosus]|uniref:Uncharacterized protein n=1 Tax=Araneus ventricosus TaxID=182803 RepID=A0A4Y2KUI0_ARAVE|nr:hypothetical protein AVEN_164094-1 [Araneus ventricosus]
MIGSSVDYVRSGGMRNVPVTKAVEHLYATTAKFSGCVLLSSRPAYSYPPRREINPLVNIYLFIKTLSNPPTNRCLEETVVGDWPKMMKFKAS